MLHSEMVDSPTYSTLIPPLKHTDCVTFNQCIKWIQYNYSSKMLQTASEVHVELVLTFNAIIVESKNH